MCDCDCDDNWEPTRHLWKVTSTDSVEPFRVRSEILIDGITKYDALHTAKRQSKWIDGPRVLVEYIRKLETGEDYNQLSFDF